MKQNVPELRFAEFEGEWEEKRLGELAINISSGKSKMQCENGDYPFYGSTGVIGYSDCFDYSGERILVARVGANAGGVYKVSGQYSVSDNTLMIDVGDDLQHEFAYSYLIRLGLNKLVFGSGQPLITGGQLKQLSINIPSLPEQQKIASFLTAVDARLQLLRHKKALMEEYKKGLMQRIFSQEVRFKKDDGGEFEEWEEKRLGEVYTFKTTNSFSRENLNYEDGEVMNIHYGDIHTKFKPHFKLNEENVPFINPEISLDKIKEENYCQIGDLVIADASEDYADVGKAIEVVDLNGKKTLAGLHTILARPDLAIMAVGFGAYLLRSDSVRRQIMTIAQGTKVLSIAPSRLAEVELSIPSKEEQQKISRFLSAVDEKINLVAEQIAQSEVWKKGLMQGMFV